MTPQPNDTYRFSAGPPMPLGTRIEGVWTAKFRPVLGFSDRTVTKTRRAHVGHDVGLIGLGLVDANDQQLQEFPSDSPFLEGCRTIMEGEPFEVIVLTSNPSFTSVPEAAIRVIVSPQGQATPQPGTLTETVDLPAETVSTGVQLGPFTVDLPQGGSQTDVEVTAGVDNNEFDFVTANDDIGPNQAPATGNPACFDDTDQFDRERCQVCLIVQPG